MNCLADIPILGSHAEDAQHQFGVQAPPSPRHASNSHSGTEVGDSSEFFDLKRCLGPNRTVGTS